MATRSPIGILLVPNAIYYYTIGEEATRSENVGYTTLIGHRVRGMQQKGILFASNPAIRQRIAILGYKNGQTIGRVTYQISHRSHDIAAPWFEPGGVSQTPFGDTGLGSLAELVVLKELQKKHPRFHFTSTMDDNPSRERHYDKRGITLWPKPTIEEAIQKTKKYIIHSQRSWRQRRRLR